LSYDASLLSRAKRSSFTDSRCVLLFFMLLFIVFWPKHKCICLQCWSMQQNVWYFHHKCNRCKHWVFCVLVYTSQSVAGK